MASKTEAQEEFDTMVSKMSTADISSHHPSDTTDYAQDKPTTDVDEEDEFSQKRIDATMRMPVQNSSLRPTDTLYLPHRDFDDGRTTGVKGVIADARSFEEARRSGARKSTAPRGNNIDKSGSATFARDEEGSNSEEEEFVERWRQSRREELLREGNDIRNRRTSPSVRRYGRFDEVDAMGYLDAIEKCSRETVVVVFVYDPDSIVSQVISDALAPLVPSYPTIHFVRVPYEDFDFDPAAVPAILAYKNQGDLFANLTYVIGEIPDDTVFDTQALVGVLRKHHVL